MKKTPALLALEDHTIFFGISVGAPGTAVGELVFNTGMTGYQEVLTDPSYANQFITFTFPHIGNTGINEQDCESARIWANGCIFKKITDRPSNWRATTSLSHFLIQNNTVAISEIDTRKLTRLINQKGNLRACITTEVSDINRAITLAKQFAFTNQTQLIHHISRKTPELWKHSSYFKKKNNFQHRRRIVVYDFGVKEGILRLLYDRGCDVILLPSSTPFEKAITYSPDGIVLSNGPGDPAAYHEGIQLVKKLLSHSLPLLGICFGHQLIALAAGARMIKMRQGHHGINHPVIDLKTKRVFISSQNHNYTVDPTTLPMHFDVTHLSLFDQSIQGIAHRTKPIMGFQGHPEAHPGPLELTLLFDQFLMMIEATQEDYV